MPRSWQPPNLAADYVAGAGAPTRRWCGRPSSRWHCVHGSAAPRGRSRLASLAADDRRTRHFGPSCCADLQATPLPPPPPPPPASDSGHCSRRAGPSNRCGSRPQRGASRPHTPPPAVARPGRRRALQPSCRSQPSRGARREHTCACDCGAGGARRRQWPRRSRRPCEQRRRGFGTARARALGRDGAGVWRARCTPLRWHG